MLPACHKVVRLSCHIDAKSSQRKSNRLFAGIPCGLRYLTEAVPLSNLHGSKVEVVNRLGWLVQILPLAKNAMHSPTIKYDQSLQVTDIYILIYKINVITLGAHAQRGLR